MQIHNHLKKLVKPNQVFTTFLFLFVVYTLVYFILAPKMGTVTGILVTIPVLTISWQYGLRYGIIAWITAATLNIFFHSLIGKPWHTALTNSSTLGTAILFLVVLVIGNMRQTSFRLKEELNKRKQVESELNALYNAISQLFNADNLLSLGEQIVSTIVDDFQQVHCNLLLFDNESTSLHSLASKIITPSQDFSVVQTIEDLIFETQQGKNSLHSLRSVSLIGVRLAIPLRTINGVIGFLTLWNPSHDAFNEQIQRVLEAYAERAAAAIETQLLNDKIKRNIGELEWRVAQRTAELEKAKEHIEAILMSSNDAILLISPLGIIQQVNPAFVRLTGYQQEQAIGSPLFILANSDSLAEFEEAVAQLKQGEELARIDTKVYRSNSNTVDVDIMFSPIYDDNQTLTGIICNIRDITDRKRSIEAVRQSQSQLQAIMDNTQAIIYVKDTDGNYLLVNRQFEKTFHLSREQLRGQTDYEVFPVEIAKSLAANDQQVLTLGKPQAFEENVLHDGQMHSYISNKFPIYDAGGIPYGICGISTDITDRKKTENSLRAALAKEIELNALKTGFTSMVSHEFRTPLAVILSSSELLLRYYHQFSDEKRNQHLQKIKLQVSRLTQLMNEVLVVDQADTVGLTCSPSKTNIYELCQSIIEEVTTTQKNTVSVGLNHEEMEAFCYIDTNLFRHILQNLLSNAIKYSKPQSNVSIELSRLGNALNLIVSDSGIGIPIEYQKNMFKAFHRAKNVGAIQGTGLGLAIVKRAVEGHGGYINFTSNQHSGTTFVVNIPNVLRGEETQILC